MPAPGSDIGGTKKSLQRNLDYYRSEARKDSQEIAALKERLAIAEKADTPVARCLGMDVIPSNALPSDVAIVLSTALPSGVVEFRNDAGELLIRVSHVAVSGSA